MRRFSGPSCDRDRLLLLQAQTLILRKRYDEAREIIADKMSSIALYPSAISAVYHLYDLSGDSDGAASFLSGVLSRLESSSGAIPGPAVYASLGNIARLYRERGMCADAACVYQTVLSVCDLDSLQRLTISAKLVETLSHTQEGALKYLQRLPEVCN